MASTESHTIAPDQAGLRLDLWLARHSSASSRAKAKKALTSGKVTVDGVQAHDGGQPVSAGSQVVIHWAKPGTGAPHAAARQRLDRAGVEVLYVDEHIIVANKPAGLLTDTATHAQRRTRDSLRKQLSARMGQTVWPAHRIDRDTTGVVAFARSEADRDVMRGQWAERTPERVYLAIMEGQVRGEGGHWADWMAWDAKARLQKPSREGAPHAVLAEADWSVVERRSQCTLVEVRLVSGRRNQIRVHAMLRGHPLLGERQYRRRPAPKGLSAPRQALHAHRLGFRHPTTDEAMRFEVPLPGDLARLLRAP